MNFAFSDEGKEAAGGLSECRGGILFAEAAMGSNEFDVAVSEAGGATFSGLGAGDSPAESPDLSPTCSSWGGAAYSPVIQEGPSRT